jgi:hypothetical protein
VYLNSSRIVSGFFFGVSSRLQWIREFALEASNDNVTYIPWGVYAPENYTTAQTVLFKLPILASAFRLSVTRYVNHRWNESGFYVAITALVSNTTPFSCGCPVLPNGECCPYMNMTVRGDHCEWCKDPGQLNVVVVNECGVCKSGTVERDRRCVPVLSVATAWPSTLEIGSVTISASRIWTIHMVTSGQVTAMFLRAVAMADHPCRRVPFTTCTEHKLPLDYVVLYSNGDSKHPFLQVSNTQFIITMSKHQIQSWTNCSQTSQCVGVVGVAYTFGDGFVQVVEKEVHFDLWVVPPPLIVATQVFPVAVPLAAEVHVYPHAAFLRMNATDWMQNIMFQCGNQDQWVRVNVLSEPMSMLQIPDTALQDPFCTRFRVSGQVSNERSVVVAVDRPKQFIYHNTQIQREHALIQAGLAFGLKWSDRPLAGDSERIITVFTRSQLPVAVQQVSITTGDGATNISTTLPDHALNITHVCAAGEYDRVKNWMFRYLDVILDQDVKLLLANVCAYDGGVFWFVIPSTHSQNRQRPAPFALSVEFIIP